MIKIENVDVYGWEAAIRGMRNPMNSWDKSDTDFSCEYCEDCYWEKDLKSEDGQTWCNHLKCVIGENDLDLMQRLFKGGTEHRKYLRMITVTMDITAPLYWWKEFDTYKVGTVANSCSTMHKIHAKEFTLDDFSVEHLLDYRGVDAGVLVEPNDVPLHVFKALIECLNTYRIAFLETKGKKYWWQMIQLLPSSYNQRRTVMLNYEVAVNMIRQRKNHKLDEWHAMVDELLKLPYMKEIVGVEEE